MLSSFPAVLQVVAHHVRERVHSAYELAPIAPTSRAPLQPSQAPLSIPQPSPPREQCAPCSSFLSFPDIDCFRLADLHRILSHTHQTPPIAARARSERPTLTCCKAETGSLRRSRKKRREGCSRGWEIWGFSVMVMESYPISVSRCKEECWSTFFLAFVNESRDLPSSFLRVCAALGKRLTCTD
jgi:hypothetical protein